MSSRRVWGLTCPGSPEDVGRARRWTRDVLCDSPCADDAALIVTELTTNALLHTASGDDPFGAFHVSISLSGRSVSITVIDSGNDTDAPHLESPADDDTHGRGLRLVAQLATRVEFSRSHEDNAVTAYLDQNEEHTA